MTAANSRNRIPSKRANPDCVATHRKPSAVCAIPTTVLSGKPSSDCHGRENHAELGETACAEPASRKSRPASQRRTSTDYVFVDWGPDFQKDHAAAYPEFTNPGLNLDLGPAGINYLLNNECSGYFPVRLVRSHIARGRLRQPKRARKFIYPVYAVYPEAHNEEAYEPILKSLRQLAKKHA